MGLEEHLLTPCGLHCGVCAIRMADQSDNQKFKQILADFYSSQEQFAQGRRITPDDLHCEGCLSENPLYFCAECAIRDCVQAKGLEGCHQCDEFPCQHIDEFPLPVGKKVILRAVPRIAEVGPAQFSAEEVARYKCPECGHQLFRGAKRCNACGQEVDLD